MRYVSFSYESPRDRCRGSRPPKRLTGKYEESSPCFLYQAPPPVWDCDRERSRLVAARGFTQALNVGNFSGGLLGDQVSLLDSLGR